MRVKVIQWATGGVGLDVEGVVSVAVADGADSLPAPSSDETVYA